MGFGFQSVSRNDLPTPIQNLHAQNKIEKMQFGFFVGSVNSIDSVGEITLGGYDSDHFLGDLTFVPVAKRSLREMYPNDDLSNYSAMQRNEKVSEETAKRRDREGASNTHASTLLYANTRRFARFTTPATGILILTKWS